MRRLSLALLLLALLALSLPSALAATKNSASLTPSAAAASAAKSQSSPHSFAALSRRLAGMVSQSDSRHIAVPRRNRGPAVPPANTIAAKVLAHVPRSAHQAAQQPSQSGGPTLGSSLPSPGVFATHPLVRGALSTGETVAIIVVCVVVGLFLLGCGARSVFASPAGAAGGTTVVNTQPAVAQPVMARPSAVVV